MDTYTDIPATLRYKPEHFFPAGEALSNAGGFSTQPMLIPGVPGSGWKFEVVTHAEDVDRHRVGEIVTKVRRFGKLIPYDQALYLPTLLTSGIKGGDRVDSSLHELLFLMDVVRNVRKRLLKDWPKLRLSEKQQETLDVTIREVQIALETRRTEFPLAAAAKAPNVRDKTGRPNPGAAGARLTAMHTRLEAHLELEGKSRDSMRKRRMFAAAMLRSFSQDLWDLQQMRDKSHRTRSREIGVRLERALPKPFLTVQRNATLYFGNDLGHPLVLPRVIEMYMVAFQLMAIRNVLAEIMDQPEDNKENIHQLRVLTSMTPTEAVYADLFGSLHELSGRIGRSFRRDPAAVVTLAGEAKALIRNS